MICPRCKKETPDDSERCINCGVKFIRKPRRDTGAQPPERQAKPPEEDASKTQIPRSIPRPGQDSPEDSDAGKTRISTGKEKETPPAQEDAGRTSIVPPGSGSEAGPSPESSGGSAPKPSEEEDTLRRVLSDRYEILKKLGAGGMASVYLAREKALNRMVAIKLLPKAYTRDANFVARFKNEAQVAANLEHPHIVGIYQISEEQDLVYFVMSYIPGGSLTDRIKKHGVIPVDDLVKWSIDACSALAHGHEHGVIHRDLKPDNIMLDKNDRAVVMDYGIARAGEGTGLTQTGSVIGTPQYMSPEQARGSELDARSDIYSMGIVLYQMATGDLPFQATDAASLMYMHVHESPEPPDARNADVPEWLKNIILKCLAKNPADRFASFEELKAALSERYSPKLTVTPLLERDRKKQRTRIAVIAATAIIIIASAAVFFRWQSGQEKLAEQAQLESERQAQELRLRQEQESQDTKDDMAYEQALALNSKVAYSNYLVSYPDGSHVDEARAKIETIENEEKSREAEAQSKRETESEAELQRRLAATAAASQRAEAEEKTRQDDMAYQQAEMVHTKQSYSTYLKIFPEGSHAEEAHTRLVKLDAALAAKMKAEAEESANKDNQAFELASRENSKQSYNTYLISFPNGRNSDEAHAKIAAFEQKEAEEEKVRIALSSLSLRLGKIPGGIFLLGSEEGGNDEKPVKTVTLSGFEMSSTEITQAQYKSILDDNPSYFKLDDNCPVERVTWKDAITFCNKLSEKVGLAPCYNLSTGACDLSKNGFRLPTEAEWEYACRAESGLDYSLGDGESALNRGAWYQRNSQEKTQPAGQKTANAWGLYDMHGNVWEWCNDWYGKSAYQTNGENNPTGPESGGEKVLRGGSWLDSPKDCRSAKRRSFNPEKEYSDIGFRVVRR